MKCKQEFVPIIFVEGGIVQAVMTINPKVRKGYSELKYELVDYDVLKDCPIEDSAQMWESFSPALQNYFKKHLKDEYQRFQRAVIEYRELHPK